MQHKSAKIHKMHQIALHSIMISHHGPSCNLQANLAATCQKVLHLSTPASCFAPQLCEAIEGLGGRRSLNPRTTCETCERFSCRLCQAPVQTCSTHEDQQSHSFRFDATEQRCNNSKLAANPLAISRRSSDWRSPRRSPIGLAARLVHAKKTAIL